jgi:class 3 adenylate cyclase/predicted ATPase
VEIGAWLRSIGLGQYEQTLQQNAIDAEVLPELTDADLEKLGILLGHRKKMLKSIAAFRAGGATAAASTDIAPSAPQIDVAERRHVTVMFCDLVGSTALSATMDPEDLREVISAYHKCVAEIVRHSDGFVAQYLGDGALVYFGYPQAHEHDAELAVRAGLELIGAVRALKLRVALQTRVGIATGFVVVGDLIGSGRAQEHAIVGETPNLAARLQAIAEPGAVVTADSTRRLLGNLFEFQDLGLRDLKGISAPVRAWVALRPSAVESRFEALHGVELTSLLGREEETDILLRRWHRVKGGEGQVVLLSGEPGIGKSRLTAGLLKRVADEPHVRLRYFCSPQHAESALYPIIGQLERAAGFEPDDDAQSKLDKLDALLVGTPAEDAALLAELLSLPNPGRYPSLDLTPQQRRQKTLQALISQLEALARRQSVVMIFDDMHWVDPTSSELLSRTIERIRSLPVMLIVAFRPEFTSPWTGQSHVTTLALNRLRQQEIQAMIHRIMGNKSLPADVVAEIIERSDGIPLFVEEMTKAVLESGSSEVEARHAVAGVPSAAHAVPATLHASLMARLDRLGSAREVAQIGAAIGREFSYELVAAVARLSDKDLEVALDRLTASGLVFRQGAPPHASFLFKHALLQDAAYGTLLREPRRDLHARIAKALTENFSDMPATRPEILAHHFTQAGLIEQAAGFWGIAGQKSIARSALVEAVAQLTRALNQIASVTTTPALRREQIKLQIALAGTLMHVKGYSSPEVIDAFEQAGLMIDRAESLGEHPEDPLLRFSIMYGLWAANYVGINLNVLLPLSKQFLARAEQVNETVPLLIGNRLMGTSLLMLGQFETARAHLDRAVALYVPEEHRPLAVRFGQDIGATALAYRAWALWLLGYPDAALKDIDELLKTARDVGQAGTLMYSLLHAAIPEILSGHIVAAERHGRELAAIAQDKGTPFWRGWGLIIRGWTSFLTRNREVDAAETIAAGLDACDGTGATIFKPLFLSALARTQAASGRFDQARSCLSQALDHIQKTKESWSESELHRTAGELALEADRNMADAEAHFHRSLAVAREQNARSLELRAAMSLARLWRDQGERDRPRELLAPIYNWFTEGFDTPDLKEARTLLTELG